MTGADGVGAALLEVRRAALRTLPASWPLLATVLEPTRDQPAEPQCTLALAGARSVGATLEDAVPFAAAWLLICEAVRILDDVGDRDNPGGLDRALGAATAMNVGSGLLVHATCLLARMAGPPHRLARMQAGYHAMAMQAFAGQGRDLAGIAPTLEHYQEVVEQKTALPFAFACWGAAALHTDDRDALIACRDAGYHAGVMLQLLDDTEALWFPDGPSDLALGKLTYPIYFGLNQPGPAAAELRTLALATDAANHEPRILELLDDLGVRDRLAWAAVRERDAALAALARCPDPAGRAVVQAFTDWTFRDVADLRDRPRRGPPPPAPDPARLARLGAFF